MTDTNTTHRRRLLYHKQCYLGRESQKLSDDFIQNGWTTLSYSKPHEAAVRHYVKLWEDWNPLYQSPPASLRDKRCNIKSPSLFGLSTPLETTDPPDGHAPGNCSSHAIGKNFLLTSRVSITSHSSPTTDLSLSCRPTQSWLVKVPLCRSHTANLLPSYRTLLSGHCDGSLFPMTVSPLILHSWSCPDRGA